MSDNDRKHDLDRAGPDENDGTRVASIAPASVSSDGGESTRNVTIGALLNHTYRVEALLARGGMGEVYRATHVELGTEHAIKVILPELTDNSKVVDMFRREAGSLRNVRHDAVVAYDGVFRDEHGRLYLVMEFVSGPSLSDRLRQGRLDPEEVLLLRDRIAGGLAAAHEKGIIHRDMSPDNVILPGGQLDRAKILDFGIAKLTDPDAKTIIGEDFAGKYSYVSPEQLGMYGGVVDARSDIYSVGLVLAAAARGRPLDMGMSPLAVVEARRAVPDLSDVPELVREPLSHMLQPDPKDRPQSMAEIIGVKGAAGAAASVTPIRDRLKPGRQEVPERQKTRPPSPVDQPGRQSRSVLGVALGVGVATMLAGGVGYYFLAYKPNSDALQASRTEASSSAQTPAVTAAPSLTAAAPAAPAPSLTPAPALTPAPSVSAAAAIAPAPPTGAAPPVASETPSSPTGVTAPAATVAAPAPITASPLAPPPPAAADQPAAPTPQTPATAPERPSPSVQTPSPSALPPPPAAPPPRITTAAPQTPPRSDEPSVTALLSPPPAPPSAEEVRRKLDTVLRNFSCAQLQVAPTGSTWTVSGFVATAQDLRRLTNDLAEAGVSSARVEAEVVQRPLCEVAELLHAMTAVQRDEGALRIGVNSPNRSYRDGDQLVVNVTSHLGQDRFLYVSFVDKEGSVLHLLPKPGRADNRAATGKTLSFGQQKEYMIGPPFGTDMIIAVASPVKLFDSVRPEEEPGAQYFADLQAALRKSNPKGPTGPIVSNYILITTSP